MRFSLISSVLATLSSVAIAAPASQPATAELTTRDITVQDSVHFLQILSDMAQNLELIADEITPANGPLLTIDQGPFPKIINGIADINKKADDFKTKYAEGETVFDEEGCNTITTSYSQFVDVNQKLLNILIGKTAIFPPARVWPFAQPVSQALEQLGGRYSDLGKFFVGRCEGKLKGEFQALSGTVTAAIDAYKRLAGPAE